ncbi:MAG: D-aminoacyl-tRNA deacylase [Bacteroidaceae bacterium]|nr:D-aminoacyl-tRNA deacylase [Bacteroidaceae bacterium]
MRTLLQRVTQSTVTINGKDKSSIQKGLLVLVGIEDRDTEEDIHWLCRKIVNIRLFDDENGVMNRSVKEVEGELLVISQFTLQASTKRGNRPSYIKAAKQTVSEPLYHLFCQQMEKELGKTIQTGEFGADMKVSLVNDGPVTIFMDSKTKE